MSVLSRSAAFEPLALRPIARFARGHGVVAVILAIAATLASPAWADNSRLPANSHAKSAAADLNSGAGASDSVAKAGVETRVATVRDCVLKQAPVIFARADHGTVVVKQQTGPGCNLPSMIETDVFYTSDKDFKGSDKLYILGFLHFDNLNQTYTILVK